MTKIIYYYSRSGHNKKLATLLAEKIQAKVDEIKDLEPRGFIMSGYRSITKAKSKIEFDKNPDDFDAVIVASPIWAGGFPPAIRAFFDKLKKFNSIGFISVSGSGKPNEHYLDELEKSTGININPRFMISDEEFKKNTFSKELEEFAISIDK